MQLLSIAHMRIINRSVFIFVFGVMLFISGCKYSSSTTAPSKTHSDFAAISTETKDGNWIIAYAVDGSQLSYAIICGPSHNNKELVIPLKQYIDDDGKEQAFLSKSDGSRISIANSGRIFFYSQSNITQLPDHITGALFKAFIDSNPSGYSASDLRRYASAKKN